MICYNCGMLGHEEVKFPKLQLDGNDDVMILNEKHTTIQYINPRLIINLKSKIENFDSWMLVKKLVGKRSPRHEKLNVQGHGTSDTCGEKVTGTTGNQQEKFKKSTQVIPESTIKGA